MLSNFSFVHPQLAGSACPAGSADALVPVLQQHGFKTVVTLTEQPHPSADAMRAAGINAVHMPVQDFDAPAVEQMSQFAAVVGDESNAPVLVHCRAGIGRTGTMLAVGAATLMRQGKLEKAPDVVAWVRQQRPGSLEVAKQVEAFCAWEAATAQ